ncbi:hypothetical protein PENSPDRAFT_622741 [Peniophora sp. CONT]|nr:hypothetical protein PENSPDRAFT_622741 [Peniophora sp. CONT]
MSTQPNSNSGSSGVVPSEVGWQFVPQYYTFVNKSPDRLHCFYTKASTFIHGTEGEDGEPSFGQQDIHNKITSLEFEDCKVFIRSVDAQSSANNGIIIQVIGEMSNRGEAWRKFAQTFFLAEQPNGYYVLNDIFRFLKEDTAEPEDGEAEPEAATEPAAAEASDAPSAYAEETPVPAAEPEPEVEPEVVEAEPEPEPEPAVPEEPTSAEAAEPEPTPAANGHAEPETKPEPEAAPEPVEEKVATPAPATPAQPSPAPTPAPAAAAPSPAPTPAQPSAPAQPAAPPKPKTWASLAASNSKQWGAAVASDSRGTSEVPAASTSQPASGAQTPVHATRPLRPQPPPVISSGEQSPAMQQALSTPTPQCFVKSVQENISETALRQVLTSRFGPIKELEIVRSKACAFLEFNSLDAARRAIAASLPIRDGGENGIRIDANDGSQGNIRVEVRKERGERPVSRPRGGAPINGGERGSFRGRGAPRGRGIGGPK